MEKKYKGPSIMEELWEYIKMIIFVVMVVFVINNLLLINARIPSESMENTIIGLKLSITVLKVGYLAGTLMLNVVV